MKRPSFQFYPGDYLRDAGLRSCSVGARGLWMDMICHMHDGNPYGHLKVGDKVILPSTLSRMVGATLRDVEKWLKELLESDVYSLTEEGCVYSRRMIKDEKIRQSRASGGHLGGNPKLLSKSNGRLTLPPNLMPTPSSAVCSLQSSTAVTTPTPSGFDRFWKSYPKKKSKGDAERFWKRTKLDPFIDQILEALQWQKESCDWTKQGGQYIPNPASYLSAKGWLDEKMPSVRVAGDDI